MKLLIIIGLISFVPLFSADKQSFFLEIEPPLYDVSFAYEDEVIAAIHEGGLSVLGGGRDLQWTWQKRSRVNGAAVNMVKHAGDYYIFGVISTSGDVNGVPGKGSYSAFYLERAQGELLIDEVRHPFIAMLSDVQVGSLREYMDMQVVSAIDHELKIVSVEVPIFGGPQYVLWTDESDRALVCSGDGKINVSPNEYGKSPRIMVDSKGHVHIYDYRKGAYHRACLENGLVETANIVDANIELNDRRFAMWGLFDTKGQTALVPCNGGWDSFKAQSAVVMNGNIRISVDGVYYFEHVQNGILVLEVLMKACE